jgi:hypothetical protein
VRLIPRLGQHWKFAGCVCLCIAAGACSGAGGDSNPFAQASNVFTKPDVVSLGSKSKVSSVVLPEDLIGADGTCGAGANAPAQPAAEPAPPVPAEPAPPATDGVNPRTPASATANDQLLQPAVGLALGLSECDVIRRAGQPDNVNVGTDERGERSVVLTYSHGERAGIYRFRQGRLFTIERAQVAEEPKKPVKPKAPAKPVKRAAKPAAPAASFADPAAAQAKPAPKTAWPSAPAAQQQPAQNAPWPAAPAQQNPQTTVWPAPPKPPSG